MTEREAEQALGIAAFGVRRLESKFTQEAAKKIVEEAIKAGWIRRPEPQHIPPLRHKRTKLGY